MLVYRLLSGAALLGSIAWVCFRPGWDSACAALAALVTFAASFLHSSPKPKVQQVQSVGKDGIGIQAGHDANIGTIKKKG